MPDTPPPTSEEVQRWLAPGGTPKAVVYERFVRLADAYMVAVEVAKRLHWFEPLVDPMPPAHAAFLRAIREENEGGA